MPPAAHFHEDDQAVERDTRTTPDTFAPTGGPTNVEENLGVRGAEPGADRGASPRPYRPSPRPSFRPDYRARSGGFQDRRPYGAGSNQWSRPESGPPASDLLGEDEELIAGRHPVEEAFIARRKAIRLLVVPQRRQALEKLVLHATNLRIPIVEVEGGTLTSLAGFDGHQGVALVTDKRQFAGLDDILARAIEHKEAPFILVLDSLEDPQNFGSLLRTAEASGVHGVIYPVRRQAPLSAAAIKSSAGAVEHLLLVPVEDLAEALTDLHVRGLRIVGSDADASLTARQADLRGPVVVVVGSEGQGLGPAVRRRCDAVVRIPMRGRVTSLNAAVAGSILLYEASSQRGGDKPLIGPSGGVEDDLGLRSGSEEPLDSTAGSDAVMSSDVAFDPAGTAADPSAGSERGPAAELDIAAKLDEAPEPAGKPTPKPKARRRSAAVSPSADETSLADDGSALLPGATGVEPPVGEVE
jgi:23S rRNA (guanosine2251-2'-O)-methyltransferase